MVCAFSTVFAVSEMDNLEGKIYLDSRQIMVGDNGIFANLDGQITQIEGIFHDNEGLFFSISDTITLIISHGYVLIKFVNIPICLREKHVLCVVKRLQITDK
jgi:hypothetical protein